MENSSFQYAGFWRRAIAHLLDGLIVMTPFFIFLIIFGFSQVIGFEAKQGIVFQLSGFLIGITWYVAFISSRWQATPGKRIMDVYVGRQQDASRLGIGRTLARWAVYNIYILPIMILGLTMYSSLGQQPPVSPTDQARMQELIMKQTVQHQTLTPDEQNFITKTMLDNQMFIVKQQTDLTDEQAAQYRAIQEKNMNHQPLTEDEKQLNQAVTAKMLHKTMWMQIPNILCFIYLVTNALMIGCSKEKAGIHDRICGTRAFRGRTL